MIFTTLALIIVFSFRRGINHIAWTFGYLVCWFAGFGLSYAMESFMPWATLVLGYLGIFAIYPWTMTKQEMEVAKKVIEKNTEEEERALDEFNKTVEDWIVIKIYENASRQYELYEDKDKLEANQIRSWVKSSGVTTLSVHKDMAEKACLVLGIQNEGNEGDEQER
jgi:hypothetical protein